MKNIIKNTSEREARRPNRVQTCKLSGQGKDAREAGRFKKN